jgi:hypothetical protein
MTATTAAAAPSQTPPRPADFLGQAVEAVRSRFVFVDLGDEAATAVFKMCVARTAKRMARSAAEGASGAGGEPSVGGVKPASRLRPHLAPRPPHPPARGTAAR